MTEPTWKDPPLAKWSKLNEPQSGRALLHWGADADPIDVLEDLFRASDFGSLVAAQRLANEIRAELAWGREVVEVLREVEWSGKSTNGGYSACPGCEGLWPIHDHYQNESAPPKWAGTIGHAPDCRLAKLIGEKPANAS